jgi:hypothetical protein
MQSLPPKLTIIQPRTPVEDAAPRVFRPSTPTLATPRAPSADDLKPLGPSNPTDFWSMTMLPIEGETVHSPSITWGVEYAESVAHHKWDVWLSRLMLSIYKDCARFRCPYPCDHAAVLHIRRDGAVTVDIEKDGDVASTLFRNSALRLQGSQILDFPNESRQNQIDFKLSFHYGKAIPNASIWRDPFGQPDARFPIEKTYW